MGQDGGQGEIGAAARTGAGAAPGGDPQAGAGLRGHGAGRQVLVIEDESNISEAIRFILRRDGWTVAIHASGTGALEAIERLQPHLVILDVMLPGESGYDILRGLRRLPIGATLPVLLLTARGGHAARDLAREAGATMFMAKPFANADLLAAVRQLVGV
jgi:DNA-binding response OmpR family regulator